MKCHCTVNFSLDRCERCVVIEVRTPKARKVHICDECGGVIYSGEEYRREILKDSKIFHHKYCEDCLSIREVFFSSGWIYGQLWNQMVSFVNQSDGNISVSCIKMLTKKARDKVLDLIDDYWSNHAG